MLCGDVTRCYSLRGASAANQPGAAIHTRKKSTGRIPEATMTGHSTWKEPMTESKRAAWIKLFLRWSLASSFLSAVADRFGLWSKGAVWGDWASFVEYTGVLNPWAPESVVSALAIVATGAEIILGIFLLVGLKTRWSALASGALLVAFGLAMTVTSGIKAPLDFSVFSAAAAAFGLSLIETKFLEVDQVLEGRSRSRNRL